MGIDFLDIIFRLERNLKIELVRQELDLSAQLTVGEFYEQILSRVELCERSGCKSSAMFYRLQRGMVEVYGLSEKEIGPPVKLKEIIPLKRRRRKWRKLAKTLGLSLPSLCRPWWIPGIAFMSLGLGFCAVFFGKLIGEENSLLIFLATILFALVAIVGSRPLAWHFPDNCQTVRGLVYELLAANGDKLWLSSQGWTKRDVWDLLVATITSVTGTPPERVTRSALLFSELGID